MWDTAEVRGLWTSTAIGCWGAVTLMTGGRDLVHEDSYVRRGSIEYVKDTMSQIADWGGEIITIVPSTVGKVVPMASPEDEWKWAVEASRSPGHGEELGVRIGLEPLNRFETYFINRADQALALAEDVGGNCGVCLDTFHMNIEEADWAQAIRARRRQARRLPRRRQQPHAVRPGRDRLGEADADPGRGGYEGCVTVEFVATVDRSRVSERTEIADASESEGTQGMEQFLRDHGTGTVPAGLYDQYVQDSIDRLKKAAESVGQAV